MNGDRAGFLPREVHSHSPPLRRVCVFIYVSDVMSEKNVMYTQLY